MGDAVTLQDGIGRKELQKIRRRFLALHRERQRRIEGELSQGQRVFTTLLPLLFHINHPMLPGFVNTKTPAGIPDYNPAKVVLQAAKKLSRSFEYKKRARRRYHIQGLYLMGSIGSIAHTARSDLDIWLCHDPGLGARALKALRQKVANVEAWAAGLGLEAHIFLINPDAFRRGERDGLSHESSGSTQPRLLLEEFYRTGVLLAGRYPLWWLVPVEEERNYDDWAAMLLHKRFVNPLDCIDFGGLQQLPVEEFFGAAHWQLFKGIESPYKTILKILLTEAYSEDYPRVRWLCQEAKAAVYAGEADADTLDPYVLLYRRLEQYLAGRGETRRLELARRCFYFKTEQKLSRRSADRRHGWRRDLLQALVREWGWKPGELALLDSRDEWKIDRVLQERNTLVRELTHSYRLLTDFARTYARDSRIDPEELSLLGRKLYTALEKRPGKIDSINPGISRSLVEPRVSLHYARTRNDEFGWFLFLGEVTESQAEVTSPIKTTSGLIEMLTWCHLNQVLGHDTLIGLYPESGPVQRSELHALLCALRGIYPDGIRMEVPMEALSAPPSAIACTLFINTGTDPMAYLSRQGKQLTSNRSDPLSFGAAHACLVEQVEQLVTTSWGETLVLSYQGISGLLDSLCHFLRLALLNRGSGAPPRVTAHSFSSVRSSGIARRVEALFNDVARAMGPEGSGLDTRYLLQAGDEYYLIQRQQDNIGYLTLNDQQELLDLLAEPRHRFRPLVIDPNALQDTPLPELFRLNRKGVIQLFHLTGKGLTRLYVLDEHGALFQQELPATDEHYLLLQQQRFLDGIRLMRSLMAEEPAHRLLLDAPEFFALERDREGRFVASPRTPPRHRLPDNYLELRLVSEGLDLNRAPHVLVCGEQEFSSLEHGPLLLDRVVEYILSQRRSRQSYPIYLTGLELSGVSGEGVASTCELYRFKKRLERRLNRVMEQLTRRRVSLA